MDFDLTAEQQQILEYGDLVAQRFDRKYWMDCAEKHVYREWSRCTCSWKDCRTTAFRC